MNKAAHAHNAKPVTIDNLSPQDMARFIVRYAAGRRASDLFVLSDQHATRVMVRRLGLLEPVTEVSLDQGRHLINSIKASAGMDIAEKRRPQEGRWLFDDDQRLDLRINCIATLFGEDMTLRILDRGMSLMKIDQLGMRQEELGKVLAMLSSPSGLILVTGPTGSGKTTTLYACLQHLNDGRRKINTLEDPIEYSVKGLRQAQVNPRLGIHFAELLRNTLRQSPDVIMVGEVRDEETAVTAVRAANSGHLVLATLHAPVAAGAVQSMTALGVHPHFLATSLLGIVAQRLMRVLHEEHKVAYDISMSPDTFEDIEELLDENEGGTIYGPGTGDPECPDGYDRRTGLFEVLSFNRDLRRMVAEGRPAREIQNAAIKNGMVEFRRGALLKVAQGTTSTEEMLRVVPSEYLGLED